MSPSNREKNPVYKWCRILVREVGVKSAGERRRRRGHKPDGWRIGLVKDQRFRNGSKTFLKRLGVSNGFPVFI
jgi:hypothetical protein